MSAEDLSAQQQSHPSLDRLRAALPEHLALLPLFKTVIYPLTVTPLALSMQTSLQLLEQAPALPMVGLVTLRSQSTRPAQIRQQDFYEIGTAAIAHRLLRLPDGTLRVAFECLERIQIMSIEQEEPFLIARITALPDQDPSNTIGLSALGHETRLLALELLHLMPAPSDELQEQIRTEADLRRLSYVLATHLIFQSSTAERQAVLGSPGTRERLERIKRIIARELGRQRQSQPGRFQSGDVSATQAIAQSVPQTAPEIAETAEADLALSARPQTLSSEPGTKRVALITGATRGIGAATARLLASKGMQIAICGRTVADGEALVQELGGEQQALFIEADLSRPDDCARVVNMTLAQFGRLDVLVNNAASVARGNLENTTAEDFDRMMALNLRAPFLLSQRALPIFKAQFEREDAGGVIINIGSINSHVGAPNLLAYSTSKGGLVTMTRNLAYALSPWRIRVHVLNVGWTLSEGEAILQRDLGAPADWAERAGANKPWGRLLQPEEIAAAVAFLASPEAAVFSGISIDLEQLPIGSPIGHPGK